MYIVHTHSILHKKKGQDLWRLYEQSWIKDFKWTQKFTINLFSYSGVVEGINPCSHNDIK